MIMALARQLCDLAAGHGQGGVRTAVEACAATLVGFPSQRLGHVVGFSSGHIKKIHEHLMAVFFSQSPQVHQLPLDLGQAKCGIAAVFSALSSVMCSIAISIR